MTKINLAFSIFIFIFACFLSSCQEQYPAWLGSEKARASVPYPILCKMASLSMAENSPVLIRIFKKENTLEIWKKTTFNEYALLISYPICCWSGKLGPKYMEYDRQAPEGFYDLSARQMNAFSHYYLSLNIGFPNKFDSENGRYGGNIMIHGGCSSSGCYSMTDKNMAEIYAIVRDAFLGGQELVQIQAFPFRMNAKNMALYRKDNNFEFWQQLKIGYDIFSITHQEVNYDIEDKKYIFHDIEDPEVAQAYANLSSEYNEQFLEYSRNLAPILRPKNPKLIGIKGESESAEVAAWMRRVLAGEEPDHRPL